MLGLGKGRRDTERRLRALEAKVFKPRRNKQEIIRQLKAEGELDEDYPETGMASLQAHSGGSRKS
jgi:hypothetical protein